MLGFESGLICIFRPDSEQVVEVPTNHGTVVAVSVDPQGQMLASLHESHRGLKLCCFRRRPDGSYRWQPEIGIDAGKKHWLTPILRMGVERVLGVSDGRGLIVFDAASGLARERLRVADGESAAPWAGVLLVAGERQQAIDQPCDSAHARFDALGGARPGGRSALPDRLQLAAG